MYFRHPERIYLPVNATGNVVQASCQEDESIEILGYGFELFPEQRTMSDTRLLSAYVDVVRVTR